MGKNSTLKRTRRPVNENLTSEQLYPIIHLFGEDIEVAITHTTQYGEEYYSFVNGQHTTQGGTHLTAFREATARVIKEFYNVTSNIPIFETALWLPSASRWKSLSLIADQNEARLKRNGSERDIGEQVYQRFPEKGTGQLSPQKLRNGRGTAEENTRFREERKAISGVTKLARERAKKANLHNKKLRDCRIHYNDTKGDDRERSSIFITEGDSASGSITKSRDPNLQAVFSLRGKPLNSFGLTKKIVYENEEFNLLQAALNIEENMDGLRYNKVIIATDADTDGMHIRLLLLTFFLQFFPDLIKKGHVYILQTPLFRVRNKKKTMYCYTEEERLTAIEELSPNPEITRFKGLGEISPDEFRNFIGEDIRLDRVTMRKEDLLKELLEFYMGKNTPERQTFIIDKLVGEDEEVA